MPMPQNIGIIDLMLGIPSPEPKRNYDFMRPLFRDKESRDSFDFPVEYMFKDVPQTGRHEDYIKYTLE
ncbi:MAG TPA: amidohydrolase, partial [Myxococcota bacterium]|nr:amidohydrolase [Myxococcota bacterium]